MSMFKRSRLVMVFSWMTVILWNVLIFTLSVQTSEQSDGLSSQVTEIIVKTVIKVTSQDNDILRIDNIVKHFHNLTRKFAHAGLYFVLGALVANSFIKTGTKGLRAYSYTLLFCVVYAATDEVHQTFVPGRSGEVFDCVIDTAGAIVGIVIFWICKVFKTNYMH